MRGVVVLGCGLWIAAATAAQPALSTAVGPPIPVPAAPGTAGGALAAADVDGDGRADLLLGDGRKHLVWLKNRGAGRFDAARQIAAVGSPHGVVAADLDGDGDLDLVVAGSGLLHIENLGGGRFHSHGPVDPEPPWSGYRHPTLRVVLADFDGDGDLDLAGGSRSGAVGWAPYEGGRFGPFTPLSPGEGRERVSDLVALDVDGDGRTDLATLHSGQRRAPEPSVAGVVRWRRALGGGAFAPVDTLVAVDRNALGLERGDLDGDDRDDLVVLTNSSPDRILQWVPGGGGFDRAQTLATGVDATSPYGRRCLVVDFDGDGDDDVLASTWWNQMVWVENRTDGFAAPVPLAGGAGGAIAVADFDGDGDLDLARAGESGGAGTALDRVSWYEQGGGPWASPRLIGGGRIPGRVTFADVDGDGVLDLLAGAAGGGLTFRRGQGGGLFGFPVPVLSDSLGRGYTPLPLDADGDGDTDLLLTRNSFTTRYAVWQDSAYVPAPFPETATLFQAAVGDVDADGWPDLVAAEARTGIVWWRNRGGVWEDSVRVIDPRSYATDGLALGDLNGDGFLDIIVGFADAPVVWMNEGRGRAWSRYPLDVPERGDASRSVHIGPAEGTYGEPAAPIVVSPIPVPGDSDDARGTGFPEWIREQLQVEAHVVVNRGYRPNRQPYQEPPCVFPALPSSTMRRTPIAFADIDGDGKEDVVGAAGGGMAVCYGTGPFASFTAPVPLAPVLAGARLVEVIDVDGDGDLDLVGLTGEGVYWSERVWE